MRVAQSAEPFDVEMGQTILDAAPAFGLPYAHGCMAGNCGACESETLSDEVDLLPHSEFALSPAVPEDAMIPGRTEKKSPTIFETTLGDWNEAMRADYLVRARTLPPVDAATGAA